MSKLHFRKRWAWNVPRVICMRNTYRILLQKLEEKENTAWET
jgi:hypothetical protein